MNRLVNVDEHTRNAIEIVSQGAKVTEQTLLFILKSIIKFLEDDNKSKDVVISDNTKEGKQKIQDLIKKHKSNVYALDENLTKEQLKDYQREFKKLGVDFSVTKNGKDSYSFFFAGEQANIIEKALKNISELKSAVLENESVKQAEKELTDIKNDLPKEQVDKVKELYDSVTENDEKIKNLSETEKALFDKYKSVDELKIETKEQIANELKNANIKTNDEKADIKSIIGDQKTNFESKEEHINYIFNQLNKDEKELFIKLAEKNTESLDNAFASPGYTSDTKSQLYEATKQPLPIESVNKVEALYDKHVYGGLGNSPENKVDMSDIKNYNNEQSKKTSKESTVNKPEKESPQNGSKKFSVEGVKNIDKEIKEAEKNNPDKNRKQEISR